MNDTHSLSHTKWNCKYHVVFAPKYRRKVLRNGSYIERTVQMERGKYSGSGSMPRSCTYAPGNTAEDECIKLYGLSQREK